MWDIPRRQQGIARSQQIRCFHGYLQLEKVVKLDFLVGMMSENYSLQ
jgi:hypothetical protein